jgi:hypothetical protein
MDGVTGYPPPSNPEGLATNDVHRANIWFGIDYLGWYAKRSKFIYPLVTTGSAAQGGVLGANTTNILYTGSIGDRFFSGGRATGGIFFADDNRFGAQFGGFLLGDGSNHYFVESEGSGLPVLARPYIDQRTGAESSMVIASSTIGPGKISVDSKTQTWGANADWVLNIYRVSPQSPWGYNLNVYAGIDVLSLRDSTNIVSSTDYFQNVMTPFLGGNFAATHTNVFRRRLTGFGVSAVFVDTTTDSDSILRTGTVDRFRTSNQFYGGELGLTSQLRVGRWSLGFNGKLGLGAVHSSVEVQGSSTLLRITDQGTTTQLINALTGAIIQTTVTQTQQVTQQRATGGLYAFGNRIGRQTHTTFAYAPEGQLNLSYQFTPTLSASLGYSFLYLSRVVRANQVMNQTVDPTLVPTNSAYGAPSPGNAPANMFPYSSYWVQGFNAGLSIQY